MSRYIDADAFEMFGYTRPTGKYDFDDGVEFVLEEIDKQPTADVRENVHGEWVAMRPFKDLTVIHSRCSNCEIVYTQHPLKYNFCPNCGADMRGES